MDDFNDDAKGLYRRVKVLTGPGRRRRWSDEQKALVAAEAMVPGAVVAQIARRWQVCASQVFSWRRAALEATPTIRPRSHRLLCQLSKPQ
jgi:transposase